MAVMTNGAFFLGTLIPSEQKFLKNLIKNAYEAGYNRFVEPCCGAFAMAHLAVQCGFKPNQIECSDVTLFSSLYGYAIMGKDLSDLEMKATGFTQEQLSNPATAMYAIMYLKTMVTAGSDYNYALLRDMELRRDDHEKKIQSYIDRAASLLRGINYRPMDMYDHLAEIMDDERAIVVINPPTYKAGFEKWYDTKGNIEWKEPHYSIFDPETGLKELMLERMANKKALVICYEENKPSMTAGTPIFARYGVRKGINTYLTTNHEELAERLSEGKSIARSDVKEVKPLKCDILPSDYVITKDSKVTFSKIEPTNAFYYRSLFTHNFVGQQAQINIGVFIDGLIFGVFGYQLGTMGKMFSEICLFYGVTIKHETLRLNRLVTLIAQNEETIRSFVSDHNFKNLTGIQTSQLTKYPESKEMRGIMKLRDKVQGKLGYKLTYRSDIQVRTINETLELFLKKEAEWRAKKQ